MVRQDKITYLITFFQNEGEEVPTGNSLQLWIEESSFSTDIYEQIVDGDSFPGNVINNRVLTRLGVITTSDIIKTQQLMSEFIPFKRHNLLFINIEKIGNQLCTAFSPICSDCNLNEICDFFNEKNRWAA
ncbi:MAG: hypothetical protein H8E72_03355 [Candidatus Marinimicrobia bacterium]|nr:hypothetical protein [Candidatus Neomarinimicrobiota bacterium]